MKSKYKYLEIERSGLLTIVWLNRPEKLNALSVDLMLEIEEVARSFLTDETTRVVAFRGRGKHFSAGADLSPDKGIVQTPLVMRRRDSALGARMIRAILEIDQVTIAGIQGAAVGGAACIATACDFRIGSEDCFCGYPEVNLGMNLQWQALPLCVHLIGPARAKRMIMLGKNENARTLLSWGFLDEMVTREALDQAVMKMAADYSSRPPVAVQMIKQSINAVSSALDAAVMHMDADQNLLTGTTEDWREGIMAFREKRDPKFRGN